MKKVSKEDIRNIQLEMLKYIDSICKRNSIEYSISGGTLLGSIRHNGFIPWDDDLDIMLVRKEYEKLLQIIDIDNIDQYKLHHWKNKNFQLPYAKISNTETINKGSQFATKDMGVFIDIFPIDTVPSNEKETSKFRQQCQIKMINNIEGSFPTYFSSTSWPKSFLKLIIKFPQFLINKNDLYTEVEKLDELMQFYNFSNADYCGFIVSGYKDKERFKIKIFTEYEDIFFEGIKTRKIANHNEYLTTLYGDYMQLPPEKDRKNHSYYHFYWRNK